MNTMDFRSGNYFSQQTGFVLDGQRFSTRDSAIRYLISDWFMEASETSSYINRLVRAYKNRKAMMSAAKEVA